MKSPDCFNGKLSFSGTMATELSKRAVSTMSRGIGNT